MFKHKPTKQTSIININEWAEYVGVSRQTIAEWIKKYTESNEYDPKNIYSVLRFYRWILQNKPQL